LLATSGTSWINNASWDADGVAWFNSAHATPDRRPLTADATGAAEVVAALVTTYSTLSSPGG